MTMRQMTVPTVMIRLLSIARPIETRVDWFQAAS